MSDLVQYLFQNALARGTCLEKEKMQVEVEMAAKRRPRGRNMQTDAYKAFKKQCLTHTKHNTNSYYLLVASYVPVAHTYHLAPRGEC